MSGRLALISPLLGLALLCVAWAALHRRPHARAAPTRPVPSPGFRP